jgi:hypothetical protein
MINKALKVGKLNQLVHAIMPISVTFKPEDICSTPAFSIALCESSTHMYRYLFVVLLLLLFAGACKHKQQSAGSSQIKKALKVARVEEKYIDTTVMLFTDTSYRLQLRFFNPDFKDSAPNTTLVFSYKHKIIMKEQLACMFLIVDLKDMNNDGIKDLLVLNYSSARSNEGFYLYIADSTNKKLNKVNGFEKVLNPVLDTANNIIASFALWGGSESCSFYRIDRQNKLVNLGYGFDHLVDEDKLYNRSINRIVKKWGRK